MLSGCLNIDNSSLMNKCLHVSNDKTIVMSTDQDDKLFVKVINSYEQSFKNLDANPHTWPEFSHVMDHLKTLISPNRIMDSWFNITLTGGVMNAHMHPKSGHSVFIYHVNCNSGHPPLEILTNNQWVNQECSSGTWFLFSKYTYHRVKKNTGLGDRISISINIDRSDEI